MLQIITTTFAHGRCRIPRAVIYNLQVRRFPLPITSHIQQPTRFNSAITTPPPPGTSPPPSPPPPPPRPNDPSSKANQPRKEPSNPLSRRRRRLLPILTTVFFLTTGAFILFLPSWHHNPIRTHLYPTPHSHTHIHVPLHPQKFTPWVLVARNPVADPSQGASARIAVFTFRPMEGEGGRDFGDWWGKGVWSVEVKQPELMVSRRYTPLPPDVGSAEGGGEDGGEKRGELRMLIKEEEGGEVSRWLFRLPVGSKVGLRGPRWEWIAPKHKEGGEGGGGKVEGEVEGKEEGKEGKNIVFLAGGTGIAPAMQVGRAIIEGEAHRHSHPAHTHTHSFPPPSSSPPTSPALPHTHTDYTILWALRTPSDLPLPILHELTHLAHLAQKHNITLTLIPHIDSHAQFITQRDIEVALTPLPLSKTNPYTPSWAEWIKGFFRSGGFVGEKEKRSGGGVGVYDPRDKYIFVSGPEGFINYFAGEKGEDGESQGRVEGVVREVVRRAREVERVLLESTMPPKEGGEGKTRGLRRARWFVWKL